MTAGNLTLSAGNSSSAVGGTVRILAGSALPGGAQSSLQLLGTNTSSQGGDIVLNSTGSVLVHSQLIVTSSVTLGRTATDTLTVPAVATFQAAASMAAAFTAHGNIILGDSATQTLTVNAVTTFASSGPITANAAVVANSALTVAGSTVLGAATGGQTLTVNAVTTFTSTAGPITANAPILANAALTATGNTVLGSTAGGQTLTVYAATTFASTASITANAAVAANAAVTVAGTLTSAGNTVLGSAGGSQTLTVNAVTTFASTASITANANMTIAYGSALNAFGNAVIGTNSSNSLTVNAATAFSGAFQLFSENATLPISAGVAFQRRNGSAGAVNSGAVVGSILFSAWDGSAYGATAQMRSVHTVSHFVTACSFKLAPQTLSFAVIMSASRPSDQGICTCASRPEIGTRDCMKAGIH